MSNPAVLHRAALLWITLLLAWAAAGAAAQGRDSGLLWRIEGAGPAPSHLFGTIHVDDPRVTALPDPVARRLDEAASFTMEVTFEPANLAQLAARMVYRDGRDLAAATGPELYARLAAAAPSLGVPPEALRLFRPWALALLLVMPPQASAEVLDNVLMRRAAERGKPVYPLESVDEQVAAFESLSEPDQVLLLRHALDNRDRVRAAIARLIEAYLRRDLAAMWRISEEGSDGDAQVRRLNREFMTRLLDERNARMVERMQPQLAAGRAFIAVGALHLYGEHGLLALLEKRGLRLVREY
jgi:uncharacterized protein YbaP (TraB family)